MTPGVKIENMVAYLLNLGVFVNNVVVKSLAPKGV